MTAIKPPDHDAPHPAEVESASPWQPPATISRRPSPARQEPTPPHSLEAERECLGAVLVDGRAIGKLVEQLRPGDFFVERHRLIYAAMVGLHERTEPIDVVTLMAQIRRVGHAGRVSIADVSALLDGRHGLAANVVEYGKIVARKAAARAVIAAARQIEVAGHNGADDDLGTYLSESLEALKRVTEDRAATPKLNLADWTADRYQGEAPEVDWIVPGIIARGEAHLLAAPGDAGKGFMTLNLALWLAAGVDPWKERRPFGAREWVVDENPITVVTLYAEDSADALHRRIESLDPEHLLRDRAGPHFIAVSLPSAGGIINVIKRELDGTFVVTQEWRDFLAQLGKIPNLGLVVIDPLSCFLSLDVDKDSAAAQAFAGEMARAADTLKAAFMFTHHMRKPDEKTTPAVPTHEYVRNLIRGVSALLNGVRMAYGFIPVGAKLAKGILQHLGIKGEWESARVYWGAIVKANGRADRRPRIYVRAECGLLEDRTDEIVMGRDFDDAMKAVMG